jgi:hypothetical protein
MDVQSHGVRAIQHLLDKLFVLVSISGLLEID